MASTAFVNNAIDDPTKFYRGPLDVLRDRRLTSDQRVAILEAWATKDANSGELNISIAEALKEARERMAAPD